MPRHNFIDITGQRFGRLVVVCQAQTPARKPIKWLCRCDCGIQKAIDGANLRCGRTISCGCFMGEMKRRTDNKYRTHGMAGTLTYRSWRAMITRCSLRTCSDWEQYGGRGIKVCNRWVGDFVAFLADVGERPSVQHTLDRIDVNGNYEPSNCRWATQREQARNTRSNRLLTINGRTQPVCVWAEDCGIRDSTVRERLKRGWSEVDAVTVPPLRKGLDILYPGGSPAGAAYKFIEHASSNSEDA